MYGIPNMKLEKSVIERRINLMKAEGVEFVFNADVGKTISSEHIVNSFDAIALCCGAKKARALTAKGLSKAKSGVMNAVDFLTAVTKCVVATQNALISIDVEPTNEQIAVSLEKNYGLSLKDKHVIIVGGGDTGNDCCGTAKRLG